ncbi:MAG TPA: OmpA family protein [Prolixibacteraceae bacterium]|nr:OmpA family protein [Prolixibacteraceae bacterium]
MKHFLLITFCLFVLGSLTAQNLSVDKRDISPRQIKSIGGISAYEHQIYLLLPTNLILKGKEIEASEANSISQKYPVWDIYRYDTLSGNIENMANKWQTKNALPNGFCIIDETKILYINSNKQLDSNNDSIKSVLKKYHNRKVVFANPTINAKNDVIWFSANLEGGEGGMDLWYIEKRGNNWSDPLNAGKNVNSPSNDLSPAVYNDSILIFTSNKGGNNYDLYFYDIKTEKTIHREYMPETDELYTAMGHEQQTYFVSFDKNNAQLWESNWSKSRESILHVIEAPIVEKITQIEQAKNELALRIPEIVPEEQINIQMTNYFGIARYDLTPFMRDSLTRLAKTLKSNPDLNILICGHASPDGPENLNMMLSYYRASEAYNWLISENIDASRIYRVYGGEYLYSNSENARNFSIFTFQNPELPQQIALYPLALNENEEETLTKFGANSDNLSFHRYQLSKLLPLENKRMLLIPVNVLYFAKKGEKAVDIARQYNIPPTQLKQSNQIGDEPLKEDKVLYIIY